MGWGLLPLAVTRALRHRVRSSAAAHDSSMWIESFVQKTIRRCQTTWIVPRTTWFEGTSDWRTCASTSRARRRAASRARQATVENERFRA